MIRKGSIVELNCGDIWRWHGIGHYSEVFGVVESVDGDESKIFLYRKKDASKFSLVPKFRSMTFGISSLIQTKPSQARKYRALLKKAGNK